MNVIFFPFHKRRKPSPAQLRQRQQLEELREVKRRLDAARCFFQAVSDHDLVAASVYEINALQARYNYLLRRVKELHQAKLSNLRCDSVPLASF